MNNLFVLFYCLLFICVPVSAQEITWSVESGIGYESNVFHSPDHNYIDTSLPSTRPTGVMESPVETSSLFIPLKTGFGLRNNAYDNIDFVTELKFDTDVMLDSAATDATRTNVNLDVGLDYDLVESKFSKRKNDYIIKDRGDAYVGLFISTHSQVYVDRDTGLPQTTTGGVDLSDKYSYQSVGVKGDYKRKSGKYKYSAGFVYEDLNYDKPLSGAEYDHVLTKLKLGVGVDLSRATEFKAKYSYSLRDYSNRYARDLSGTYSSVNNDLLKYTYNVIDLELGHRFNKKLITYFDLKNSTRTDEYLGYNDYSRLDMAIRARYKYTSQTTLRGKIRATRIDYPNAYNFEDVARGSKENSGLDLNLKIQHEIRRNLEYYLSLDYVNRVSTDDRYDYTNNIIMTGAKYEY